MTLHQTSKRVRWDIDEGRDPGAQLRHHPQVSSGRAFSGDAFTTLSADEKRFVSQIQGRTYANIFGLVERFINAKVLELSRRPLVRRPGSARGAGTVQRRGAEAPGAVSPRRRDDRRGVCLAAIASTSTPTASPAPCSARAPGRCWADAGHRAIHPAPLPPEHRPDPSSPNCSRTCSSTTGERKASTRS